MQTVEYTIFQENTDIYLDKISDNHEIVLVKRKENDNVVLLSEETYNNLMENLYIIETKANHNWLADSKAQLENDEMDTRYNKL